MPSGRIVYILNRKRSISAETALRLGRYFGSAPLFWLILQAQYDRAGQMENDGRFLDRIEQARRSRAPGTG